MRSALFRRPVFLKCSWANSWECGGDLEKMCLAIMTSSATDADTHAYLRSHAYCGLDPAHVFVFCQQDLPALDAATGCLLLEASDRVAVAPDGHGGMLGALSQSGGLD